MSAQIQVKIRKRKGEKPLRTYLDPTFTVAETNVSIRHDLELPSETFLSLNGKDPIGGANCAAPLLNPRCWFCLTSGALLALAGDDETLASVGVTNGDILRVVGAPV